MMESEYAKALEKISDALGLIFYALCGILGCLAAGFLLLGIE